jgi:hypothetical protein
MTVIRFKIGRIGADVVVEGAIENDNADIAYLHPTICNDELEHLVSMISDDIALGRSSGRLTNFLEWSAS